MVTLGLSILLVMSASAEISLKEELLRTANRAFAGGLSLYIVKNNRRKIAKKAGNSGIYAAMALVNASASAGGNKLISKILPESNRNKSGMERFIVDVAGAIGGNLGVAFSPSYKGIILGTCLVGSLAEIAMEYISK